MKVTSRKDEDVTILDLAGKLTIGEGDLVLREQIDLALSQGATKLLLNMRGVSTMDSSGLGELVRAKATASRRDATIKLLHVEDKVAQVFEMTRLIGVFETYEDEIDGIASFR